ncbi:MAG: Uma2 family endonuclease [Coleofasciculus sp. C2-GNP5-27]
MGIPEFWIVDPQIQAVIVLNLQDQVYQEVGMFQGNSRIVSPTFPELNLTAETLLNAGH